MPSSSIDFDDKKVIEAVIRFHEVKSVLEFGPGDSTDHIVACGVDWIDTLEDDESRMKDLRKRFLTKFQVAVYGYTPTREHRITGLEDRYDLAFVDGPKGTPCFSRISAVLFAVGKARVVLLHDSDRLGERQTLKYLETYGHKVTHFGTKNGIAMITGGHTPYA